MANIILTEYCNLNCPYCFANEMITDAKKIKDNKNITLEQLNNILNWLMPTAIQGNFRVGLIGGEPTLHPQFKEILNIINNFTSVTKSYSVIFTNGILIDKFLHLIGKDMGLLINVNKLNQKLNSQLINNLKLINNLNWFENNKVTLGCNLYLNENNYDFFWNIVDLFPSITTVRMSVTAPNTKELKINKHLYYTQMKDIFLSFINEAYKRNKKINYDCNQIPLCYFTKDEQKKIKSLGLREVFCEPVVDITPDFKATCCFGVYSPVDCSKYKNIDQLIKFFQCQMCLKTVNNNTCECKNCELLESMLCQGGCLSFSTYGQQ